MAMQVGSNDATSGMTKDIFDAIDQIMNPTIPPGNLEDARMGWKRLAFAIATGVVAHLAKNMEIGGIQTQGSVTTTVTGAVSGTAVTGTGTGSVTSNQIGSTSGHVK
jgi:hypothetical protein